MSSIRFCATYNGVRQSNQQGRRYLDNQVCGFRTAVALVLVCVSRDNDDPSALFFSDDFGLIQCRLLSSNSKFLGSRLRSDVRLLILCAAEEGYNTWGRSR